MVKTYWKQKITISYKSATAKAILVFVLCTLISCASKEKIRPVEVKYVILITIDTLRADALSVYGNSTRTPALEEFARKAVVFENAFTCTPITLPAHASLFTGLYPPSHGVRNNGTFQAPAALNLLSEYAQQNHFTTAAIVGGFPLASQFGLNQGFDFYDDSFPDAEKSPGIFVYSEKNAEQVRTSAQNWILKHQSTHSDASLFLWLHFFDPHHPYQSHGISGLSPYMQEVLYVDQQLGLFFEFLKQKGIERNAVIILTADHGEAFGEHGEISHSLFLYNTTLRIPLMILAPGIPPARRPELVRIIDIAPTVMEILNWKYATKVQGVSLLPALKGEKIGHLENYSETLAPALDFGWSPLFSIQDLQYKYIQAPRSEYYDLKQDPGETKNQIQSIHSAPYQAKLYSIKSVAQAGASIHVPSPEEREQLESLGYFSTPPTKWNKNAADPKDRIQIARQIAELTMNPMSLQEKAKAYEKIITQEQTNPLLLLRYGEILLNLEKFSKAEKIFRQVLDLGYPSAAPYNGLATAYYFQNQRKKAEEILQSAVKLKLADGETYYNLGEFLFDQGASDEAFRYFNESMKLGFLPAFFRMARLKDVKGDSNEAFRILADLESSRPWLGAVNYERGMIFARHNRFAEAIAEFKKSLEKDPNQKELLYNIGVSYYQAGDKIKAREYLQEFLRSAPVDMREERAAATKILSE